MKRNVFAMIFSLATILMTSKVQAAECSLARETLAVTNAYYFTFNRRMEPDTDFSQIVDRSQISAQLAKGLSNSEDRQLYTNEWLAIKNKMNEVSDCEGRISARCMAMGAIAVKKQKGLCSKQEAADPVLKVGDYVYTQRHCSMVPVRGDSGWCGRNKSIPSENIVSIERIVSISDKGQVETAGPSGENGSGFKRSELEPVTIEKTPGKGVSQFKVGSKVWYIVKDQYPPQEEATVVSYDSASQEALLLYEYEDRAFNGSRTWLTRGSFGTLPYSKIYVVKPALTLRYNGNFYFDENDDLSNVTLDQVMAGRCNSVKSCERIRTIQGKCTTNESCRKLEPAEKPVERQPRGRMG